MTSGSSQSARSSGSVVGTPSMANSSMARLKRAMAPRAGRRPDDEFGDHRIVIGGDRHAGIRGRIDANARAAGLAIRADRPGRRPEILRRILGVDAPFDGESVEPDIVLKETERFAGGNPNLLADQIHSRHHFGDGMLDLNARVHFEEEEARIGDEALDRADRIVADRLRRAHGRGAHFPAQVGGEPCRRFLPEFLVAALQRAIALADVEYGAVLVGEYLQFDVLRIIQIALGVDRRVLEVCLCFAARRFERRFELARRRARSSGPCRRRRPKP